MVLFHVEPLPDETFPGAGGAPRFSVSPDGRMIVYASSAQGRSEQLRIRRLDSSDTPPLRGSDGPFRSGDSVQWPFWSPDSRTVAFFDATAGKLKRIELAGGRADVVCDFSGLNSAGTWSSAGVILFSTFDTRGIQRVPAGGGTPERVTALDDARHEVSHLWPQFLPDGRHFLFHVVSSDATIPAAVFVGELGSTSRVHLVDTPSMAVLAPPDRLLFVRGEALVAQKLDLSILTLTDEPTVIVAKIRQAGNGRIPVSASFTGVLAYNEAGTTGPYQATWRGRDGRELPNRRGLAMSDTYMRLSADGRRLAFARGSPPDIWILDLDRNVETRLTTDPAIESHPMWWPDGSKLVFRAHQGARRIAGLYEQAASGASPESLRLGNEGGQSLFPLDLTTDGRYMLFTEGPYETTSNLLRLAGNLRLLDTSSDRKPYPLLTSDHWRGNAKVSPNGHWLAYTSDEAGTFQVFVRSFPDPQRARYQVSNAGGFAPRWRRDGRELYYEDNQTRLVAVGVTTEDRFDMQTRAPLFTMPLLGTSERYEVTPDGQQFIVAETSGDNPITVAINWMTYSVVQIDETPPADSCPSRIS